MPRGSPSTIDRAIVVTALVLIGLLTIWFATRRPGAGAAAGPGFDRDLLICSWNVENFYDDRDDPRFRDEQEDWFGTHPELVRRKVGLLADALLIQNDGEGPDILAMVEVENRRCVELLRDALNARLSADRQYTTIVQRYNATGRHNAPAILSRLPAVEGESKTYGIRRILEARFETEGAPLVVISSHWTSRVRNGTEPKREAYAEVLYDRVVAILKDDPSADVLLCGDFNDGPDDSSIRDSLNAVGMRRIDLVRPAPKPYLLDLMGDRDPNAFGTYRNRGRWEILDHLIASPGLLDPAGWLVRPETLQVDHDPRLRAGRDGHPNRFGGQTNPGPRGPSDHFAIGVRLKVGGDRPVAIAAPAG